MIAKKEYLTIVIADDDADDRAFVMQALKDAKIIHRLVEVFDGVQLVNLLENRGKNDISENEPDLVFLDLNMPKMDGYDTARWLYDTHPQIKTLILTMYDSEIALIRLLQVGVRGFLKKDVHPEELKNALVSVAEDGFYYSHQTTGKLGTLFQKNGDYSSSVEKIRAQCPA